MAPIRILVVDDSVVIRKMLADTLSKQPGFEVVAWAGDGRIALSKIQQLHPDLVTLDVEMPVMDGLETLRELRRLHPRLPVIMFSTLTERGASTTLDALSLGASDYVTKASNPGSQALAIAAIQAKPVTQIKVSRPANPPLPAPSRRDGLRETALALLRGVAPPGSPSRHRAP